MNNQGWECPRCHNILGPNAMYCIFCVGKDKDEKEEDYSEESLKRIKNNIIKGDIANTITANAMQSANHNNCGLVVEPKIISHNIKQEVKVRKYPVDTEKLVEMLINAKIETGLTNSRIAFELGVPITKVEHWFRKDDSFAIPDEEVWYKLKNLLGIKTCEFDESITIFEERDRGQLVVEEKLPGSYGRNFGSKGKMQDKDNVCDTLVATMGTGGGNVPIVKEEPKIEIIGNYSPSNHEASRIVDKSGLAPTVKENHGTVTAVVEVEQDIDNPLKGISGQSWQFEQNVYSEDSKCARAVKAGGGSGNIPKVLNNQSDYRIRKLTPKECWRLMGFDDEDFEKAEKVNSNTQLYKQAGNSIVVDVLEGIFTNLLK